VQKIQLCREYSGTERAEGTAGYELHRGYRGYKTLKIQGFAGYRKCSGYRLGNQH
jgi:hypothetical protein